MCICITQDRPIAVWAAVLLLRQHLHQRCDTGSEKDKDSLLTLNSMKKR